LDVGTSCPNALELRRPAAVTSLARAPLATAMPAPNSSPCWEAAENLLTQTGQHVDSALTRAEQLGGTRVLGPVETPVSRIAVFTDPDGNRVGLVSPLTGPPPDHRTGASLK
jgi:hypothetical protein